jgi:hypothetical protein
MTIEELFVQAKQEIFGEEPQCSFKKVAYNMAHIYYDKLIEEAESVSQGTMVPYLGFNTNVDKACRFAQERDFMSFPEEIRSYLQECTKRFARKYGHLAAKQAA